MVYLQCICGWVIPAYITLSDVTYNMLVASFSVLEFCEDLKSLLLCSSE